MKKTLKLLTILFLAGLYSFQVNGQKVKSYDKSDKYDFSNYKTYKFLKLQINDSAILRHKDKVKLIGGFIGQEMMSRGFVVNEEDPDIYINLGLSVTEETQTVQTDVRNAPAYQGERNYHWEAGEVAIGTYKQGTAIVDFVDTKNSEMVWQGVASSVIRKNDKKASKRIQKTISKMFAEFPVRPK